MAETQLKGADEMILALEQIEKNVANKHVRTALRAGAKVIQRQCVADAPVKTGQTRRAIKVRAGKRMKNAIRMLVTIGKGMFKGGTFYAGFVEYGWTWGRKKRARNRKGKALTSGATDKRIPGKNWLHNAFDKSASAAQQATIDSLSESLKAEAAAAPGLKK